LTGVHHVPRVRPDEHHHRSSGNLALSVLGDDAEAERGADANVRNLLEQHRSAVVVRGHDGRRDVFGAPHLGVAADDVRFGVLLDVPAAERGVVPHQSLVHLANESR